MCHKEASTSSLVPSVLLIHNISFPVELHSNSTNSGFELTAESFFFIVFNSYHMSLVYLLSIKTVYTHKTLENEWQRSGSFWPMSQLHQCPAYHELLFFNSKIILQVVRSNRGQCHFFADTDPYEGNKSRSQNLIWKNSHTTESWNTD